MRARIHWTYPDADETEDSMVIEFETLEEGQKIAAEEVAKRGGLRPWSEDLN